MELTLLKQDSILTNENKNITNIFTELEKMKVSAIEIGKNLVMIEKDILSHNKAYTIVHVGESIFGFKKSSTYNYINVYKRFGDNESYKEYTFGQLTEMVSMEDRDLVKVNPDMKRKEIREIKKEIKTDSTPLNSSRLESKSKDEKETSLPEDVKVVNISSKQRSKADKSRENYEKRIEQLFKEKNKLEKKVTDLEFDLRYLKMFAYHMSKNAHYKKAKELALKIFNKDRVGLTQYESFMNSVEEYNQLTLDEKDDSE